MPAAVQSVLETMTSSPSFENLLSPTAPACLDVDAPQSWRRIIHVDMDAFYASVEQHDRPELRGQPIAVGRNSERGVVATASYEARRWGVRSAMPARRARELCPDLIFVPPRMERYREISQQVHDIFARYTDIIEPISIDEAFLDVTENKIGEPLAVNIAKAVKADIRRELGLTASAGVSYNKLLAKIASDWRKPDGLCTIHPTKALEFIDRLKVEHLWGVGPATAARMHKMGIQTAEQLRRVELPEMVRLFGKAGWNYWRFVRGIDDRPVRPFRVRKSVGCGHTYRADIRTPLDLERALGDLAEELVARAAAKTFIALTLTLKVRSRNFDTVTRSKTADRPWLDAAQVKEGARELLAAVGIPKSGIRLLGLTLSTPLERDARQGMLV